ncbi:MAG: hypothetical protein E7Z72_02275 [Methanocorpusculum parvum]|nr:hypothetical protein [Methanocorpusculum parvum]
MKIWKIITVLLAVLLLAGCVGCVSGAEINSITLSLDDPKTGETVPTTATASSGVKAPVSWDNGASGTFDAEKVYTATITVEPTSGNTLASHGTIKLNGNVKTWNLVDGKITISHTFQETASAVTTDSIKLTLTKPLAANTPATTATITSPSKGLKVKPVTWSPTDTKFELGEKYTATIVLESTNVKAFPISTSATAKVNGYNAKVSTVSSSSITVTYEFGETEPKGIADDFSFTITPPSVGASPSKSIKSSQDDKTDAAITWNTADKFKPDTIYTATIIVNAKEGYIISEDISAVVTGDPAINIDWISNIKAKVTCTFTEIASVSTVKVTFAEPRTGELAPKTAATVTTSPTSAAKSADIKWTPALVEGEFDAGVEYIAEVSIPISSSNTAFDEETNVYINNKLATIDSVSPNSITVKYTFPKTFFFPNPLDIIKEFYNLMLAIFNPASYAF